jgi:DNA-binding transcriptional ArsR family regulator
MLDVMYLERLDQAEALLKPRRVEVLRQLGEPRTCTQVAKALGDSPQKVYYHVKRLQTAGLVELVSERRVRGITEGIYCAAAGSYWLSPELVGRIGPRRPEGHVGLGFLLDLSEELQSDLGHLAAADSALPSLGIAGDVHLAANEGAAFVADLQEALQGVLTRYSGSEGHRFRIALALYPREAG